MVVNETIDIDLDRVDTLIEEEEAKLEPKHRASIAYREVAERTIAGGVASSWQASPPHAIYVDHGLGNRLWDIDGNEYIDFHLGYGAMVAGHAHPKIVEAVEAAGRARHALRAAHEGPRRGRRQPGRTVRTPALAVLQLRHRGDARGGAADAREHRPRDDHQDRRARTTATTTR